MGIALLKTSLFQCQPSESTAPVKPKFEHAQILNFPLQSEFRELVNTSLFYSFYILYKYYKEYYVLLYVLFIY